MRGIVAALARPVPPSNIHLGVEITRLDRLPAPSTGYRLHVRTHADVDRALEFEHLVFATQADQAARLVSTLEPGPHGTRDDLAETLDALRAFTYVRTLVVTHTDQGVLPPAASDRRDLNLAVFEREPPTAAAGEGEGEGEEHAQVDEWDEAQGHLPPSSVETTHVVLSRGSGSSSARSGPTTKTKLVLQTTNPLTPIADAHTLASTWFSRAFVTQRSQRAVAVLAARARARQGAGGARNLWFAGSYLASGIPLLEGCVTSAESVVRGVIASEGARVERWAF